MYFAGILPITIVAIVTIVVFDIVQNNDDNKISIVEKGCTRSQKAARGCTRTPARFSAGVLVGRRYPI